MTVLALDGEQRRAVETVRGPLVIFAGPGTGKTRVVTERIANAVACRVVAAESVVAVTFTEKAAAELLVRLRRLGVPAGRPDGVHAATFHSAALRQLAYFWPRVIGSVPPEVLPSKLPVLIANVQRLGSPPVTISPAELAAEIEWVKAHGAVATAAESLAPGKAGVAPAPPGKAEDTPAPPGKAGDTPAPPGEPPLPGRLASLRLEGPAPRWVLEPEAYSAALLTHDSPLRREGSRESAAGLFADLFHAYETAKSAAGKLDFEDILATCSTLVRNVEEVAAAVRNRYTHFSVDEFQDVNRLQWDLLTAWTGERDDVCVVGDENQAIYGFAGASPSYLRAFRTRYHDAEVVRLCRNYRSTQPVFDAAVTALSRQRPPAGRSPLEAVRGCGPDPLFVACDDAQDERDRVATRCRALHALGVKWQQMAILYRTNAQSEAWEQALGAARIPFVVRGSQPFFSRRHIAQALAMLERVERNRQEVVPWHDPRAALDGAAPAPERLDRLVPRILRHRLSWTDREPEGDLARERWADLAVLVDLARELFEADPCATLRDLLADLRRRAALGQAPDGGGVNLLTLHRAKGLEFEAVFFVVSVEEGRIPSRIAVVHDERCGFPLSDPRSAVDEENRLLYVGMTRARTHLHLSWVTDGLRRPSRFLSGLTSQSQPDPGHLRRDLQPVPPASVRRLRPAPPGSSLGRSHAVPSLPQDTRKDIV